MHDVVVVGAGPGGSATAHFLAQRGLDVLLVDKFAFPRDKTCGDGLTPRALRVLDSMGILGEVRRQAQPIRGYEVVAPNQRATGAPIVGDYGALVIPRWQLDDMIRQRALSSGAQFEGRVNVSRLEPTAEGVTVHAEHGNRSRTIHARVAAIATGAATGVLTRSGILKRQPRAMLAMRAYFEDLHSIGDRFQLRFDGVPLPGYGWAFPMQHAAANVGVGYLPKGRSARTDARGAYERFISGPAVSRLLEGARQVAPAKGYPIRVDFLTAPTYAPRTLLVGEAAGLVNPLTGEGIDYALESGHMAAQHLLGCFATGEFVLEEYHRRLHARFDRLFRFCIRVRDWYCAPPLLNFLVVVANRRPELRQLLTELVLGDRQPSDRGPVRMLAGLLLYLARPHPRLPTATLP
jgi:geranylgeranyl reductase family protein